MRLRALPAALRDDDRGVALIEFAFSVPILILLFVGGYQISDAVFAYRKATAVARTVANLTSQYTTVADSDLDTILSASQQVLSPYAVASAEVRVTQVTIDASGNTKVNWSRGLNTTGYANCATFVIPSAYQQNSTTIIVADVTYHYVPSFASIIGNIDLKEQVTMFPRKSTTITKAGQCT